MAKVTEKATVEERSRLVDKSAETAVRTLEKPVEKPTALRRPRPFFRWMQWLLAALIVAGIIGLVLAPVEPAAQVAPPLEEISLYENPEIVGIHTPVRVGITQLDPHESPEIMRIESVLVTAPLGLDALSLEALALLRAQPVEGIDAQSLRTLAILRGLPAEGIDALSLESLGLLRELHGEGIDRLSLESLDLLRSLPSGE